MAQHQATRVTSVALLAVATFLAPLAGTSSPTLAASPSPTPTASATASPSPSAPTASPTPTPSPTAPKIKFTKTKMKKAAAKRPFLGVKVSNPQAIAYVQKFLKIKVTGKYGKATVAAVKTYQTLKGIPVSGSVAKQTWAAILDAPAPLADVPLDPPPAISKRAKNAIAAAVQHVGKKYVLGGTGPKSFDCSGLVQSAWNDAGVKLPRTSGQQFAATRRIAMTDLLPGDLLFYGPAGSWHVAMYIGDDKIVEAANSKLGLIITSHHSLWYTTNFVGAGRVITKATGPIVKPTATPKPTPSPTPSVTASPRPSTSATRSPTPTPSPSRS